MKDEKLMRVLITYFGLEALPTGRLSVVLEARTCSAVRSKVLP